MEVKPLGEFDIYINDGNYGNIYPDKEYFLQSGVPFISATDFVGKIFNYIGIKYISEDLHFNLLTKGHLKKNDVLIVVRGNGIGKVGFFKDNIGECNINAQLAFIRTNPDELNSEFLYYLFSSSFYRELIRKFGSGSAQPQLPINRLKLVPVIQKEITTQNKIAKVLSDLDAKIELNNKINTELEAMAKLLYDYWFVQFDFPDENGKPYKSSGGKMVYNERLKREIPDGWEVFELAELLACNYESIGKNTPIDEIAYLDTSSLTRNIIENIQPLNRLRDKIPSRAQRLVRKNDILYSTVRPRLCHYGIMKRPVENMVASTGFVQLSSKVEHVSNDLLYTYLTSDWVTKRLQQIAALSVSSYPSISPNDILALKIATPKSGQILEFINTNLDSIYNKISLNQKENKKLAELRDWLLPMLMNGQVKVQ